MKMKITPSLLGFFLVLIAQAQVQAESVIATAGKVTGNAYVISPGGKSTKITEGAQIPVGSSIHTDADSTVGLKLVPGATTVVAPNTDLKLSTLDYSQSSGGDKSRKIRIALQKGSLFSSLAKHDGKSDFRISTPDGVAAARGTDWEVSYSPGAGLSVSCTDGIVYLTLPGGSTIPIPGGKITTSANGTTTVTGDLSQDQIDSIISTIEAAGFSPANGTTPGSNGAGTYNNNGQSSNPANISAQPTVSGNQ